MKDRYDALDVALGEVPPELRAAAEARLQDDARFRAEVERLRAVAIRLETLPDDAWGAPPVPELRPLGERRLPLPRRRRRMLATALAVTASFAAGLAVAGLADDTGGEGRVVALAGLGRASDAAGRAVISGQDAAVRVEARGLARLGRDRFYELWLLDEAGRMVSLGTFRAGEDGRADIRVPLGVEVSGDQVLDVSVERADGNPGHSGDSVLRSDPL